MNKKELTELIRNFIQEAYMDDVSSEDQMIDTDEFEDSLGGGAEEYEDMDDDMNLGLEPIPLSSVDMPIQDKAYLSLGGEEPYDDEFSDLNGYKEFGDDYEGNYQDDASVSPGYFSESELAEMIREGVEKLHKQTLIENRIEQINNELNMMANPEAWENARMEAQNQLRKKNVAWQEITQRERLIGESENLEEKKYSDAASDFIGKEIGHLQKDKGYEHDRAVAAAINIAKDKGYKVPKKNESKDIKGIQEIMLRASKLMSEANKKMNDNSAKG